MTNRENEKRREQAREDLRIALNWAKYFAHKMTPTELDANRAQIAHLREILREN